MCTFGLWTLALLAAQTAPVPEKNSPADGTPSQEKTFFEYRDATRGITLKMENGRVELSVPREDGKSMGEDRATYKADSIADFKRQYPEVAKKYELDRLVPKSMSPQAAEAWWHEWAKRFGGDEGDFAWKHLDDQWKNGPDGMNALERWFDREHQRLLDFERQLRKEGPQAPAPTASHQEARFGIQVAPVGDALRAQLGLHPNEGLVVMDVQKGSLADATGLKPYDVLLNLSGQRIDDSSHFKDQVLSALQSKEFVLEVLRRGSPLKLTAHPAHS